MSNVTLYSAMPSRGMMPHWALEESGIEYNLQLLDLDAEENKQPDYLALNPLGKVPTLVHGDTVVTESAAIVAYVAETFADGGLAIAPGSPERGAYLRWLHFAAGSAEGAVIWNMLGDATQQFEYQPFAEIDAVAATLKQALTEREFVLQERFTAADIMLGSTIMWGMTMVPALPQDPVLVDYWQRLAQRPRLAAGLEHHAVAGTGFLTDICADTFADTFRRYWGRHLAAEQTVAPTTVA